jgi:hypothetical protein
MPFLMSSSSTFKAYLLALFLLLSSQVNVHATTTDSQDPDPALVAYLGIRGSNAGYHELERIRAHGISGSPANVKLLREALALRASADERATLISILGRLYDRTKTSEQNTAIKGDLRNLAQSSDRKIARAAVFGISRMGGDEELKDLLQNAKSSGNIDNDEYAGELAINVRFSPPGRQLEYVALLDQSDSKYGIDVLTSNLGDPGYLRQYSPGSLTEIEKLLKKREPNFPLAIGEFGYVDVMRFTAWLQARALILEQQRPASSLDLVLQILVDPSLDPRKAIGYLSSPEAAPFLSKVSIEKLKPVLTRINAFAESFPQNKGIQESSSLVFVRINSLRK